RLVIRVSNAGDEDAEDSRVSLKLNEQVKAITDIDLPANSTVIDTINFSVTQPGKYQASIEITDYPITFDDEFFFAFEVSETMPVMAINEEKTSEYLTKLFGNDKYFEFKNAYSKQLDYSELGNYQLIILNELLSLPSGLNGELKQFVKRGGSLLIFPSMKMDLSGFNSFLSDVGTNSFYGIDDKEKNISKINYEQEVFADVFMELPENMDLPKVKLSYLFTQKSGAGEETLLTFNDGKTFLGKYTVGRGKVYLCASPLDENVSYLPVHSIFIPLMYKVAWLSKKQSPLYYTIGNVEHIEIESEVENSESIFKLKGKELEFTPQQKVIGASVLIGVNEQLNKAGIYSLFLNDDEPINNLAFNYDRKESALSFFSKEDLMLFTKESDIKLIDEIGVNLTDIVQGINEGIVLWKLCLIFALIFLGVEIILLRLPALTG
ncbi:MAG: hypothetical protein IH946_06835, partial [Bacteroidetes bacterium]|nr:hypothetical protein [Bacteroidota bacterium]